MLRRALIRWAMCALYAITCTTCSGYTFFILQYNSSSQNGLLLKQRHFEGGCLGIVRLQDIAMSNDVSHNGDSGNLANSANTDW